MNIKIYEKTFESLKINPNKLILYKTYIKKKVKDLKPICIYGVFKISIF